MRMPQMDGTAFFKRMQKFYPDTVRIVLTGYADRASVSQAFSQTDIYESVPKPWEDDELKQILHDALEYSGAYDSDRLGLHKIINEIDTLPPRSCAAASSARRQLPVP